MMRPLRLVFPLVVLFLFPDAALSQQQSRSVLARITIPEMVQLDVSSDEVEFPMPGPDALKEGALLALAPTVIQNTGNVTHMVWIRSDEVMLMKADGTPSKKPISDLQWSIDAGKSWRPLSVEPQLVFDGTTGASDEPLSISYRLSIRSKSDNPGNYTARVLFTVTNP